MRPHRLRGVQHHVRLAPRLERRVGGLERGDLRFQRLGLRRARQQHRRLPRGFRFAQCGRDALAAQRLAGSDPAGTQVVQARRRLARSLRQVCGEVRLPLRCLIYGLRSLGFKVLWVWF